MFTSLADSRNFTRTSRPKKSIKYIVVHYTANDGDTARNNLEYYRTGYRAASAHFYVDEREVCCSVPWYFSAWHCGDTQKYATHHPLKGICKNFNSIGVEMCSRKDNEGCYYFKPETMKRAAHFIRGLMEQYNVPIDRVVRHYDVSGKLCPRPFVDEAAWGEFKKLIVGEEETEVKYFEKVVEVPEWYRPAVEKLIEKGFLKGTTDGLHLSEDMVRMLTILDRAGAFGE